MVRLHPALVELVVVACCMLLAEMVRRVKRTPAVKPPMMRRSCAVAGELITTPGPAATEHYICW